MKNRTAHAPLSIPRDVEGYGRTSYHVTRDGKFAIDPYEGHQRAEPPLVDWTAAIGWSTIYSRAGALKLAQQLGGVAVMLTRNGKVRVVHGDGTRGAHIATIGGAR